LSIEEHTSHFKFDEYKIKIIRIDIMFQKKILKKISMTLALSFCINTSVWAVPGDQEKAFRDSVYEIGNKAVLLVGSGDKDTGIHRISTAIAFGAGYYAVGEYIIPIFANFVPVINTFRDWGGRIWNSVSRELAVSKKKIIDNPEKAVAKLSDNFKLIVGQESAKETVKQKLSSFLEERSLFGSAKGACVLYCYGDSGVGKSEMANVIATCLCEMSDPLVLNPSMLKLDHSKDAKSPIEQFFGNETVYGIAGEKIQYPTKIAKQIYTNPSTVLVMEEIDKMRAYDPSGSIDEFLRQIMDRGYATVEGRKLDFRDTIIIITSNESRSSLVKGCSDSGTDELRTEVDHDFSLLNRLTLVEFGPLSKEEYIEIAKPKISRLVSSYLKIHKINVALSNDFLDIIGDKCCQGHKGARCIQPYLDQIRSLMVEFRMAKGGNFYRNCEVELKFNDSLDSIVLNEVLNEVLYGNREVELKSNDSLDSIVLNEVLNEV
jgi:hypothetical protein